jgi:hypothetical protein
MEPVRETVTVAPSGLVKHYLSKLAIRFLPRGRCAFAGVPASFMNMSEKAFSPFYS